MCAFVSLAKRNKTKKSPHCIFCYDLGLFTPPRREKNTSNVARARTCMDIPLRAFLWKSNVRIDELDSPKASRVILPRSLWHSCKKVRRKNCLWWLVQYCPGGYAGCQSAGLLKKKKKLGFGSRFSSVGERRKREKRLNPESGRAHASCATSKPDTYYISFMCR